MDIIIIIFQSLRRIDTKRCNFIAEETEGELFFYSAGSKCRKLLVYNVRLPDNSHSYSVDIYP